MPMIIVGAAAVAVVLAFILLTSMNSESGGGEVIIPDAIAGRTATQNGAMLGREDAPAAIVEYFSFTCPHCGHFALDTALRIEKEYIEPGLVRFELRALAAKGPSLDAAVAALCAADQGRYWDYHDVLFANYEQDRKGAYNVKRLREYAVALGLDAVSFNDCLESRGYETAVLEGTAGAVNVGINSTPAFFLGLTKDMKDKAPPYPGETNIVGAQPYEVFKEAIEEELRKAQ